MENKHVGVFHGRKKNGRSSAVLYVSDLKRRPAKRFRATDSAHLVAIRNSPRPMLTRVIRGGAYSIHSRQRGSTRSLASCLSARCRLDVTLSTSSVRHESLFCNNQTQDDPSDLATTGHYFSPKVLRPVPCHRGFVFGLLRHLSPFRHVHYLLLIVAVKNKIRISALTLQAVSSKMHLNLTTTSVSRVFQIPGGTASAPSRSAFPSRSLYPIPSAVRHTVYFPFSLQ